MSQKDFHKSMGDYLDVKRNGPKKRSRKSREPREPLMNKIMASIRQARRKFRIFWKRVKAFFGAEHELDLTSLHHDVYVIERDEKASTVFWRQFKSLFKSSSKKKKQAADYAALSEESKQALANSKKNGKKSLKNEKQQPEDVDLDKINDIIKNNAL